MDIISFNISVIITLLLWTFGIFLVTNYATKKNGYFLGTLLIVSGIVIVVVTIVIMWINLERPPLRTLGETRLWYSAFLSIAGLVFFFRWKYNWFLIYSFLMAILFLALNVISPENFNKSLMPALQSYWFVPHVIVYIIAYALLGASSIVAIKQLYNYYINKKIVNKALELADNLVCLGFSFLTMGLLFGALWAKEAWGHYWTWDPKETWAFLTWSVYLLYIHGRIRNSLNERAALWILALGFAILIMCWFGVNYLPSASLSVHTYTN